MCPYWNSTNTLHIYIFFSRSADVYFVWDPSQHHQKLISGSRGKRLLPLDLNPRPVWLWQHHYQVGLSSTLPHWGMSEEHCQSPCIFMPGTQPWYHIQDKLAHCTLIWFSSGGQTFICWRLNCTPRQINFRLTCTWCLCCLHVQSDWGYSLDMSQWLRR